MLMLYVHAPRQFSDPLSITKLVTPIVYDHLSLVSLSIQFTMFAGVQVPQAVMVDLST